MSKVAEAAEPGWIRVVDRFPTIVVEFVGSASDEVFERYLADLDRVMAAHAGTRPGESKLVFLFDAARATGAGSARQRQLQAGWLKRQYRAMQEHAVEAGSVGLCFVITNPVVRGGLTAVFWLTPIRGALEVVATRDAAEAWCRAFLAS